MIAALALGAVALLLILRFLFGSSDAPANSAAGQPGAANPASPQNAARSGQTPTGGAANKSNNNSVEAIRNDAFGLTLPIVYRPNVPSAPSVGRNIFAFYVPPVRPTPLPPVVPTPTPLPPPPLILSNVAPANVYAGTGEFAVEVTGDKFTPATRIMVDDREVPTRFVSAQRLAGNVPEAFIAMEGARRISVRTVPDGALYSNTITLNVAAPPKAPYTYVALIGGPRANDVAVLKEQGAGKLINVQRGQVLADQWRVTSISEREVVLTHTTIRIKQRVPFVDQARSGVAPGVTTGIPRPNYPQPQPNADDDQ